MKYSKEERRRICERIGANPDSFVLTHEANKLSVNYRTLRRWIDDYNKNPDIRQKDSIVMVIPDLHCPFEHPDALDFLKFIRLKFKPTDIICLGDEADFHAFSRFPTDPDGYSPGTEAQKTIEHLIPFYVEFPELKVCVSNHTIRPKKLMKECGIPAAWVASYSMMLNAPDGWEWADHYVIDDVRYMHGDLGRGGKNGWCANSEVFHMSCVVGHWHSRAGVYYDSKMFNLNAGCLIDASCYAFDYAKGSEKKPNLGCGLVIDGEVAHFIPLRVDEDNRWIGRL